MRKIIGIILVIAITTSLAIPAFAEETEVPQYGSLKVEYSDSRGSIENLEVMILDGYVYANVDSFSSRLGYKWEQNQNVVSIYGTASLWGEQTPALALHFRIGDTTVSYNPMCGIEAEYTTPAPCVQNERGIWIPFSYTLYLLGGSRNIAGDVVTVQMPAQNVLSIAAMITNNESVLSFDWVDDFGYSETATNVTDGAARIVTLFEGLLSFDGSAWTSFVDWNAFDKKFGKTLAALMCTYSSDELKDSIEEVEVMLDVFDPDGALGSMLRTQETLIDSDVNAWEKICKEKLAQLKAGCGTLPQYNMAYQQYERATKKQDLFSAVGADEIIYIQDGLAEATNALEWAKRIGYGVTYLAEFQQRDDFQASVLKNYFATRRDTDKLDDAAAKAIADYASSDIIEYTLSKFFENHALEILVDESGLDALMGVPANLLLLAWDIMSETIPFYSDGLDSVENREISNYAQQVQNDAYQNLNTLIASLRADTASLSPEDCVRLAEYCYVYLKSCYIARSFAIDSLENISEEAHRILESEIDVETEINQKIAEYLSVLSRAGSANSCYILGFLPKNNEELVDMYTDEGIVDIVILGSQNQTPQLQDSFAYVDINTINAVHDLLIGVGYPPDQAESAVTSWSDERIFNIICSKRLWDWDSAYLAKLAIGDEFSIDLSSVEELTQDMFGREFPINVKSDLGSVSGNKLNVELIMGESTELIVENGIHQGDSIRVEGSIFHHYVGFSEFHGYFKAELVENPSSIYGYTLTSIYRTEGNQNFDNITASASSELKETTLTHYANRVIDGDLDTAWVEGVRGVGIDEWIKLETTDGSKMTVSAIEFSLGYQKSEQLLQNNGMPSKVLIECENGYEQEVAFCTCSDVVILDKPQTTSWIKITILEATSGAKYDDTCISEIQLHGMKADAYLQDGLQNMPKENGAVQNNANAANSFIAFVECERYVPYLGVDSFEIIEIEYAYQDVTGDGVAELIVSAINENAWFDTMFFSFDVSNGVEYIGGVYSYTPVSYDPKTNIVIYRSTGPGSEDYTGAQFTLDGSLEITNDFVKDNNVHFTWFSKENILSYFIDLGNAAAP